MWLVVAALPIFVASLSGGTFYIGGTFIRWHFYPVALLSGGTFVWWHFYPVALLSSGTFVRGTYSRGTFVSGTLVLHPNPTPPQAGSWPRWWNR